MSPIAKYSLGRVGVFVVVLAAMLPTPLHILIKVMIAVVVSAIVSYFVLAKWRNEMTEHLGSAMARRQAEKQRLRAALAGDEAAAAEGDRAVGS